MLLRPEPGRVESIKLGCPNPIPIPTPIPNEVGRDEALPPAVLDDIESSRRISAPCRPGQRN